MTKKLSSVLLVSLCLIQLFTGCSNLKSSSYDDNFWNDPNTKLEIPTFFYLPSDNEDDFVVLDEKVTEEVRDILEKEKENISSFMKEKFSLELPKLDSLEKIYLFEVHSGDDLVITAGYCPTANPDGIYINKGLLEGDEVDLQSTILHEALHYAMCTESQENNEDPERNVYYVIEGITDALCMMIAEYSNEDYSPAEPYTLARQLTTQMIIADGNNVINTLYQEKSLGEYINSVLKENPSVGGECENYSKLLEYCLEKDMELTSTSIIDLSDYTYYYALQAQSIVSSYCKNFSLSNEEIQKIRENYVIEDIEVSEIEFI